MVVLTVPCLPVVQNASEFATAVEVSGAARLLDQLCCV